jgi:adenosylcobinamide-GDP ribazoletransferase
MRKQLTLFFTALQFYTRFPAPGWLQYHPENLSLAVRYLPLVGWLVGLVTGITWLVFTFLTNSSTGLLFAMIGSVLTTGAFHEDGFTNVCNGFGGGWTKVKILEIMKDSRVGTYGTVGLIMILALKFSLLLHFSVLVKSDFIILVLLLSGAHAISRFMSVLVISTQPYARETQDSKAKPEAADVATFITAGVFGLIPVLVLSFYINQPLILLSVCLLVLVTFFLSRYFKKWIGGYTGDCLGAVQQICEVVFYVFMAGLWKFV